MIENFVKFSTLDPFKNSVRKTAKKKKSAVTETADRSEKLKIMKIRE